MATDEENLKLAWQVLRRMYREPETLERRQYLVRLRHCDGQLLRALGDYGAASAEELQGLVWTSSESDQVLQTTPALATVSDWLIMAHRRGLVSGYQDPEREGRETGVRRWQLIEKGELELRRPRSSARLLGLTLRHAVKFLAWVVALAVGSATVLEGLGNVDVKAITESTAFEVVAVILIVVLFVAVAVGFVSYVRRSLALAFIELTRKFGSVASLDDIDPREEASSLGPKPNTG